MTLDQLARIETEAALGISADDEVKVTGILEHARLQLTPSQATDVLFLVHPYFVQFTPELAPTPLEMLGLVRNLEASINGWKKHRDTPDVERALVIARASIAHIKNGDKVADYLKRLEGLVSNLDTSKVRLVLVEAVDDYWRQSASLVESGRVNSVLITKYGVGVLLESQTAAFTELLSGVKTAYVAGSYANLCPFTFAKSVRDVGVRVVPVADLLFSYNLPPEMIPTTWRDKGFKVQRAARSIQLPRLAQYRR